ncbi:MAG: phosphoribosylaminoimidazolesuccinocarboxamide synthase, partial [Pyrinomonadaceae bacterium]
MMGAATLLQTSLSDLKLERRGKVRDVYAVDDEHLLIVATDRISAFDSV